MALRQLDIILAAGPSEVEVGVIGTVDAAAVVAPHFWMTVILSADGVARVMDGGIATVNETVRGIETVIANACWRFETANGTENAIENAIEISGIVRGIEKYLTAEQNDLNDERSRSDASNATTVIVTAKGIGIFWTVVTVRETVKY